MPPRVLVVTGDTLAAKRAGPAIRAWEVAHALAAAGHDVSLLTTAACSIGSDRVRVAAADGASLRAAAEAADVVVVQGYVTRDHPWLLEVAALLVADLYDPLHLEALEQGNRSLRERTGLQRLAVDTVNDQLRRADLVLCASPRQRDLWVGHLASLGRVAPVVVDADPDLSGLVRVAPFGLSAVPPVPAAPVLRGVVDGIGTDDRVVLWGGGLYGWFDPVTLIRAVDVVRAAEPRVRLVFLGTRHPNPSVPPMPQARAARAEAEALGLLGSHVFLHDGWVGYDERASYLLEADVGVSCHFAHVETAYSFRTRILDYLWAGLPVVTTAGDGFADLVAERDLGAVVPPVDVPALAAALTALLTDDEHRNACAARVSAVAPDFTWDRALAPLVAWCADPRPAPDRVAPPAEQRPARSAGERVADVRGDLARARAAVAAGGGRELLRRGLGRLQRRLG